MKNSALTTETPAMYRQTAVVILSAGNSVRMRSHKALLRFDAGHDFIQKIVSVYAEAGIKKRVVVVNKNNADAIATSLSAMQSGRVQLVLNEHPEWERFYSIKCGLAEVARIENCFIHNCDNPFVGADIIRRLLAGFSAEAVTVPEFKGRRGHPVLLSRNIIQAVIAHPENSCNFKSFLSAFRCNLIPVDDSSILFNINTRDDLHKTTCKHDQN